MKLNITEISFNIKSSLNYTYGPKLVCLTHHQPYCLHHQPRYLYHQPRHHQNHYPSAPPSPSPPHHSLPPPPPAAGQLVVVVEVPGGDALAGRETHCADWSRRRLRRSHRGPGLHIYLPISTYLYIILSTHLYLRLLNCLLSIYLSL